MDIHNLGPSLIITDKLMKETATSKYSDIKNVYRLYNYMSITMQSSTEIMEHIIGLLAFFDSDRK